MVPQKQNHQMFNSNFSIVRPADLISSTNFTKRKKTTTFEKRPRQKQKKNNTSNRVQFFLKLSRSVVVAFNRLNGTNK